MLSLTTMVLYKIFTSSLKVWFKITTPPRTVLPFDILYTVSTHTAKVAVFYVV
jgi:hypothetical protein